MKTKIMNRFVLIGFMGIILLSCLEAGDENLAPGKQSPFITMSYNTDGTLNNPNSGLRYFGNSSLTYPPSLNEATETFFVTLQGTSGASKDINVTLVTPESALDDYYYIDSIEYEMMPDNLYDLPTTTGVIEKGSDYAEFSVTFYPSLFDPTKNYMLPIGATTDSNLPLSENYGFVYFHAIGNPIAGAYSWDFNRLNCSGVPPAGCTQSSQWTGEGTIFAPTSPTAVKVPTGYFVQPNFLITFKNNAGVLSDFKAEIAPDELKGAYTDNGITIVSGPTIVVENNNTKFTIKHVVFNGAAYRDLTDVYYIP